MSNIYVYSKGEFVNTPLEKLNDKAIIRVYNSRDKDWKDRSDHYLTLLEVFFDDVQLEQLSWHEKINLKFPSIGSFIYLFLNKSESVLFTEQDAQTIIKFIKKHKDKDFAIQCEYGKSRSIAIALFMKKFFKGYIANKDAEEITHYNEFVYNTLKKTYKK